MRIVIALAALGCSGCSGAAAGAAAEPENGGIAFAMDLYRQVAPEPGNVCISPYSVRAILALTREGAAGETREQMERALHLAPGERPKLVAATAGGEANGFTLDIANSIWVQMGLKLQPQFASTAREEYGARAAELDFAAAPDESRKVVNDWVAERTRQKILDLLEPGTVTPMTAAVLANAVYLNAKWRTPFKHESTREQDFHLADATTTARVPTMAKVDYLPYAETNDAQILELPYADGRHSLLLLLPKLSEAAQPGEALRALETSLTAAGLGAQLAALRPREVDVALPRFTITTASINLNEALQRLGIVDAFSPKADFSAMFEGNGWISDVVHKAFIRVDEEGTEAAAATAVTMLRESAAPTDAPVIFHADHPFLYAIVDDEAGEVLFFGRVMDPR